MTIKTFSGKYFLHDSNIKKVIFDKKNKTLILEIEFCFWLQNWYIEGEPTNGIISVTFENVSLFDYDKNVSEKIFSENLDNEIINVNFKNNTLILGIRETVSYQPIKEIFYSIKIKAEKVEVTEIKRYDL